jgi:hypothetical protein
MCYPWGHYNRFHALGSDCKQDASRLMLCISSLQYAQYALQESGTWGTLHTTLHLSAPTIRTSFRATSTADHFLSTGWAQLNGLDVNSRFAAYLMQLPVWGTCAIKPTFEARE